MLATSTQFGRDPSTYSPTDSPGWLGVATFILVEKFAATNGLGVVPVFNFNPTVGIEPILALPMLSDHAFKILFAGESKKTFAFTFDVIHIENVG